MPTRELVLRLRLIDPDMAARIVLDPTGEAVRESGARHEHGSAVQLRIRGDSIVACHGDCEQRLEDGVTVGGWELRGGPSKDPLDVSLRDRTIWSRPVLRVRALAGQPRTEELALPIGEGEQVLIGRSAETDLVLDHPSISRQHLRVVWRDGGHWVEDLGSTWGTSLQGRKLQDTAALRHGDVLRLGEAELEFHSLAEAVLSIPPVPAPARHPPSKPEPEPEPEPKLAPAPPAPRRRLPPDLIVFAVVTGLVALGLIYLGSEVF